MEAILLKPGEGEEVRRGRARILAGRPEAAIVDFRYGPGEKGPERHIHHRHADGFYVLDGELTVEVGDEVVRARPGAFVLAPPGVVHTFRNESEDVAHFINLHAPSERFHDHLRGTYDQFDQHEPPADGGRPASDALVLEPGAGTEVRIGDGSILVRAGADQEPGTVTLLESRIPPGFPGPIRHVHRETSDSFYVLEGTLALHLDDETVEVEAGTFALVPPGTVHTFSNPSDSPVHVLNLMFPAGFERYFVEVAATVIPGAPPDPAVLGEIAAKYDFEPAG